MDPEIVRRFNENILNETMLRFGISPEKIRFLGGFESYIYNYSHEDGEYILRIGHSLRRTQELIQGEVDWINYLATGGASVAKAVLSNNNQLVEYIDDHQGEYFMATAFEKAPGVPPTSDLWNEVLFKAWGRLLGRIHALTKDYEPADPSWRRGEWDSPGNMLVETWLPPSETEVLEKFRGLMRHLSTLPKGRDNYGLIHQDAHAGNFTVDQDYTITLFDFDDCVYGWFIYDIAMVLFYGLMGHEDDPVHIQYFCRHFLDGYQQENALDPEWLVEIPYFLKLREIDLYAQILFSYGGSDNIEEPWDVNYMKGRRHKIESGLPYIDFDWGSLEMFLT
jgi:Ser/Thr protein kinase RdoA (MazF antagonist)